MEGVYRRNVFTFRSLDDTNGMLRIAGPEKRAVVIGGGLLGLEAARGLQMQGCDVTVVHIVDTLMNNQLDSTAGEFVQRKMEEIGIRVLTGRKVTGIMGRDEVEAVEFSDGERIPADLVVIAAGIRPNADVARKAGIECSRGILVNDYMETSDPRVYAVGECTEHRGEIFGLVAPLFEQGKVLAAAITGNREAKFEGWKPAAKLKVMGVDVFSAGEYLDSPGTDVVRYEDAGTGTYKKLLVRANQLVGCILVGDVDDSNRYMEWLRSGTDLVVRRRSLLFPEPVADKGSSIAEMPDSETVCGCMGVTKGNIITAIHDKGISTMAQLKECTRASTGCGSCAGVCQGLLKAVSPDFEEDTKKVLCKCVPFTQDNLREIIQSQKIKSVQDVLDIYGNGIGCEICKPALSYLVDVVWCGEHSEDRSARFINDRVHANIQNDGTFSVVPRMRGGVTTPDELRRIADVAERYSARLVKVTGSQRIDLLGIKKADLPKVWADLGMPSGQAYTKGVRMVKTCVGTEFCRFGVQDAMGTGIELERRLENLFTPHKTKLGVTGCPRNCAEVTVKDIGLVGQEGSWQVVVGGAAGKHVRKADLLITVETTEEALEASMLFFQYYRENGNYLERTYDFVERFGIEHIRKHTVYAPPKEKKALLRRLNKAKALSRDAWGEGATPATPTQFVQIQPLAHNSPEVVVQ
jgi:nitrite reductase (NADH) large subunit